MRRLSAFAVLASLCFALITSSAHVADAAVTPRFIGGPPPQGWFCVKSCANNGTYMRTGISYVNTIRQVVCLGPNTYECSWYADASCTQLASGSQEPEASQTVGQFCQYETHTEWCEAAYDYHFRGISQICSSETGEWRCIQSCADGGRYIRAQRVDEVHARCMGPYEGRCSWFSDSLCSSPAPDEMRPDPSGLLGLTCHFREESQWCRTAFRAIAYGVPPPTCNESVTTTAIVPPPTTEAIPTVTSAPPPVSTATVFACNQGSQAICGTSCVDLASDPMNCGSCVNICQGSSPRCVSGVCQSGDSSSSAVVPTETATVTPSFAPTPTTIAPPLGATTTPVVQGQQLTIRTANGTLTCTIDSPCTLSVSGPPTAYTIRCVDSKCTIIVLQNLNGGCLAVIGTTTSVGEASCPSLKQRRASEAGLVDPYWTLLSTGNSSQKLMHPNRGMCLLAKTDVSLGSCDSGEAGGWIMDTAAIGGLKNGAMGSWTGMGMVQIAVLGIQILVMI